ncbi:MAG: alpha/beta fold hydrolase, partial [Stellaceae bacterium]
MIQLRTRSQPNPVLSAADMIALWERLLHVAPIGPDDDFFDLGGDSLQALTLFHEIERTTGRSLPITAIYEASTPSRVMALLADEAPSRFSPLVRLKSGVGEPLYIVHGIGGNVLELFKLGQLLDTTRPVYAIQAKGVDGSEEPHDNVADMVDYYLAHLRSVQPRGPYFLAGYSFGGIVAMDMARRLQAQGENMPLVAFIDSYAHPNTFPKKIRQLVRVRTAINAFRT